MELARERAASIAILTSIPMVAQLIGGRAVRDALFLTEYDAAFLPPVMLAAAVLSLGTAVAVGRLMPRRGPRTTAVALALLNGGAFAIEAALLDARPAIVAVATYLHVSVVGALLVSAFSSIVNERFDPLYAKTVVAQVGTGAALGGVLGGVAALFLADAFELGTVLYGLAGLSLLIALGVWNIGAPSQPHRRMSDETGSGLQSIRKDVYLRRIAMTIVLLGAVGVFVDYAMKAEADARFESSADLLSFFAAFYMATSLLTFLTQAGVAKPLLQRIGLGGTMVVLPLTVAVSAGLGTVWTGLWTATAARGAQTVVSSSLFRSGYELLYTPVTPMKKRATKAMIDVACNRVGYGVGSCVVMAIVAISATAENATSSVLAVATVVALVSAWMIRKLNDGYVHELASSLRDGSIALRPDDVVDATTLHTLAQTGGVMTRSQLLESIEELERSRESELREKDHQAWLTQVSDLLSDQPERVLHVLLDESLNPRIAAPVIDLLGNDVFARAAYQALERMGPEITGQLVDAMLRSGSPVKVRRRIPRLLRKFEGLRAVEGLLAGLRDREFDVRCRCGRALADLKQRNGSLNLREDLIIELVEQELTADQESWQHRQLRDEVSPDLRTEIDELLEDREDRNLQHVFTLLSLALDRDAVILSLRALSSQDDNLRGTALEYLHNILPGRIRESLWPRLTERSERLRVRSARTAPDELLKSMRSLMLDRDRLVK